MAKVKRKSDGKKTEKPPPEDTVAVKAEDVVSVDSPVQPSVSAIDVFQQAEVNSVQQEESQLLKSVEIREPTPEYYKEPVLTQLIVERYEGETVHGLYDGEGTAYFEGGHSYKGTFAEGLMHGKGIYYWADGITYEGDFVMNVPVGHGVYRWPDGSTYEGEVYNGKRHGLGTYKCGTHHVSFIGEWNHSKRHGKGTIYYDQEGTSWYEGDWLNNVRQGWGIASYKSGNLYEGQWKNHVRHGEGTMKWVTANEQYTGQWVDGTQHGHGTHTWFLKRVQRSQYPLRNKYVGRFANGFRHGNGKFFYASGAVYDGEWQLNKKHGWGKFIFKNGRIFEGEFVDDRMAEFPDFTVDGMKTPDLSGIRTQNSLGTDTEKSISRLHYSTSLLGPNLDLDISSLLEKFPEEEREEEMKQVCYAVLRHNSVLRNIYSFYSSIGVKLSLDNTFLLNRLQFWRFLKDCKLHYHNLTLADMDRILYEHAAVGHIHFPFETMLLRTFLSSIIYLAYHIHHEEYLATNHRPILVHCFSRLVTDNILPNAQNINGRMFNEPYQLLNAVGDIRRCWKIYNAYCPTNRKCPAECIMKIRQFIWMLKDLRLLSKELNATKLLEILAEDNPSMYDGSESNLELEMTFLEFYEALLGCAVVYVTDDVMKQSEVYSTRLDNLEVDMTACEGQSSETIALQQDPENHVTEMTCIENAASSTSIGTSSNEKSSEDQIVNSSESSPMKKSEQLKSKECLTERKVSRQNGKSQTDLQGQSMQQNIDGLNSLSAVSSVSVPPMQSVQKENKYSDVFIQSVPALDLDNTDAYQQEEPDKSERAEESDLWLNRLYVFFMKKFFPAHEYLELLKKEAKKYRAQQAELARQAKIKAEAARLKALKEDELKQMEREQAKNAAEEEAFEQTEITDPAESQLLQPSASPKEEAPDTVTSSSKSLPAPAENKPAATSKKKKKGK